MARGTVEMTRNRYAHVLPDTQRASAEEIDDLLAAPEGTDSDADVR